MSNILQFWIPVIISIIAIIFTGYQQFISNKQFLFDKRLSIYQLYKTLSNHQKNAGLCINESNKACQHNMLITALTNDSKLSLSVNEWEDRDNDCLLKMKNHIAFLSMIEELRNYGTESVFIFDKHNQNLCDYFNTYADLCYKVYQYSILMKSIENDNKEQTMSLNAVNEEQKSTHEEINRLYIQLCKLSNSIKLPELEKTILFIRRNRHENHRNKNNGC